MEQTVNKDQDPPHGGSFVRNPDGSLQLREGTKPADETIATEPQAAEQAPTAAQE